MDGHQSPWESISPLEIPPPYYDYPWPTEYPPAPTSFSVTLPPMPTDLWHLDEFENIDMGDITLEDLNDTGLGLSLTSGPTAIPPQPSEATSGTAPTQTPVSSDLMDLNYVPENNLPECLDQLCTILRRHYPETKPPGRLFRHFIFRENDLNHCKLCSKALENKEQMHQHIMSAHCSHFPFGCDEPGW